MMVKHQQNLRLQVMIKNLFGQMQKLMVTKIIVSSDECHNPKYVRYAWADDPVNPNLINKEGLPAAPFRTDE